MGIFTKYKVKGFVHHETIHLRPYVLPLAKVVESSTPSIQPCLFSRCWRRAQLVDDPWNDWQSLITNVTDIVPVTSTKPSSLSENVNRAAKCMGFSILCTLRRSLWRQRSVDDERDLVPGNDSNDSHRFADLHQCLHCQTLRVGLSFCHLDTGESCCILCFHDTQPVKMKRTRLMYWGDASSLG